MSSTFWAINAAKRKKHELVPGSSKWVANELYLINSDVLTHTENYFHDVSESLDQMNVFMKKVLKHQDDKGSFISSLVDPEEERTNPNTPSNFTYISPNKAIGIKKSTENPQSSPINSNIRKNLKFIPKTPSPLKNAPSNPTTSPNLDLSFIPIANTIKPDKGKIAHNEDNEDNLSMAPGLEDSFHAISTAIRKSIAGKSAVNSNSSTNYHIINQFSKNIDNNQKNQHVNNDLNNSVNNPAQPESQPSISSTIKETVQDDRLISARTLDDTYGVSVPSRDGPIRKSTTNKTPKRSSIFVSLPSREPITINSSNKATKSNRYAGVKSRSSRVFERLDIASRHELSTGLSNGLNEQLSPISIRNKTQKDGSENSDRLQEESTKTTFFNKTDDAESNNTNHKENAYALTQSKHQSESINQESRSKAKAPHYEFQPQKVKGENEKMVIQKQDGMLTAGLPSSNGTSLSSSFITNPLAESKIPLLQKKEGNKKIVTPERNTSSFRRSPLKSSIDSVLRRARNALSNNSQKSLYTDVSSSHDSKFNTSPKKENQRSRSPTKSAVSSNLRSRTRSPVRPSIGSHIKSPTKTYSSSRSPTRYGYNADSEMSSRGSPNPFDSDSKLESRNAQDKAETDLINRLMVPTSSSAAKSAKAPSLVKSQHPRSVQESRKPEPVRSRNRFLTTTLNPTNPPVFNPVKPPHFNTSKSSNQTHPSPVKKIAPFFDNQETKLPLKLESNNIPLLKKKSLMAERSEAAAQKPKKKILISMNHKLELKTNNQLKIDTSTNSKLTEKTLSSHVDTNGKSTTTTNVEHLHKITNNNDSQNKVSYPNNELERKHSTHPNSEYESSDRPPKRATGNSIALPDVARGNLSKHSDNSIKRRKTAKDLKTPLRTHNLTTQKILEKKATRVSNSERRTPYKNKKEIEFFNDPKTPAKQKQITADTLPDIPTDEEDNYNKKEKVLQSWAHTPELHKLIMQNRDINPVTIFGEIPKLNIEEVFESQASRYRGRQSSSHWSPGDKQRREEEREYAIEMGYKDRS